MKIGIIGAGLQGRRRASAIKNSGTDELVVLSAAHQESAKSLATKFGCEYEVGWEPIVNRKGLEAVVVCTPPNLHAQIAVQALSKGKHVLCEKPLARNANEARMMIEASRKYGVKLKCGFNYRHHPALAEAKKLAESGALGNLYYVRAFHGIGARHGYEKEWRSNPSIVSGGQLMEQGIHLIDLSRWFLGEFSTVFASLANFQLKTQPLEDNAFVILQTLEGKVSLVHSSLTQWKNLFRFEVFGSEGYLAVEGLGGSYGTEKLCLGKNEAGYGFASTVTEFRGDDPCWSNEWAEFVSSIREDREPIGSAKDGLSSLLLVEAAYRAAREGTLSSPERN